MRTYGVCVYKLRGLRVQVTGSACTKRLQDSLRIRPKREERTKFEYKIGDFAGKIRSRNTGENV